MKQIGNSVLSSKYTVFAADTLDGALNVADKYVDRYLPADEQDKNTDGKLKKSDGRQSCPDQTVTLLYFIIRSKKVFNIVQNLIIKYNLVSQLYF